MSLKFSTVLNSMLNSPKFCRSEEHTSELQSQSNLVCRLLLEKKKNKYHYLVIRSLPFLTLSCSSISALFYRMVELTFFTDVHTSYAAITFLECTYPVCIYTLA